MKLGADINARNQDKESPIHIAVQKQNKEIISILLKLGADINARNRDKESPIHIAVQKQNKEIISILLKLGADINAEDYMKRTPLLFAVKNKDIDIINFLIENGVSIDPREESTYEEIPLHQAVVDNEKSIVELLLKNGGNIEATCWFGNTALIKAVRKGTVEMVQFLISCGADIEAENDNSLTPLLTAVHEDHIEAVEILLENGAKIDYCSDGITAIHVAIVFKKKSILQTILNSNPNISNQCFASIFPYAVYDGNLEIIRMLIEYRFDIDAYNPAESDGRPPIHVAITQNKKNPVEITKWLLTNGASQKIRDRDGNTPLESAMNKDFDHKLDLIKVITFTQ